MEWLWKTIKNFFREFNTWLIIISFFVLIIIKILTSLTNSNTADIEKGIRNIHFSGKVIAKDTKRGTYYLEFEKEGKIYLPNHELMRSFYNELEMGSEIRKRRYFSNVKVRSNGTTQYYEYPKNLISFVRNNLDDYSN